MHQRSSTGFSKDGRCTWTHPGNDAASKRDGESSSIRAKVVGGLKLGRANGKNSAVFVANRRAGGLDPSEDQGLALWLPWAENNSLGTASASTIAPNTCAVEARTEAGCVVLLSAWAASAAEGWARNPRDGLESSGPLLSGQPTGEGGARGRLLALHPPSSSPIALIIALNSPLLLSILPAFPLILH
ncbi:uncharacterized protein VTP21DRAFT_5948 [Calcarisporiella thermophila]|uniref:uncharacterized protein n=1 Tax=Calcarisporiella thermophila TaxID=911321 RepID=UPI003743987E